VKILLNEDQLQAGVRRMADKINAFYGSQPLTIVGVLTGSIVLLADLIRLLEMPLRVGVLQASSYRGDTQRGSIVINSELMLDIHGRDVLLVDDIFDTGHTIAEITALLEKMGARTIRAAVMLSKEGRAEVQMRPDFVGFDIPNEFVVGYGLDYQDHYRNLRYLAALEPHEIGGAPS
jgi:hypoxanthine phosphoribosyltransferase